MHTSQTSTTPLVVEELVTYNPALSLVIPMAVQPLATPMAVADPRIQTDLQRSGTRSRELTHMMSKSNPEDVQLIPRTHCKLRLLLLKNDMQRGA